MRDRFDRAPESELMQSSVRLHPDVRHRIQKLANSRGVSFAALLRDWVHEGLDRETNNQKIEG